MCIRDSNTTEFKKFGDPGGQLTGDVTHMLELRKLSARANLSKHGITRSIMRNESPRFEPIPIAIIDFHTNFR